MENPVEGGSGGWEVRECLFELQRYFSDRIAPLMVHDSIGVLLRHPPGFVVNEIEAWAAEQRVSDFRRGALKANAAA